MPFPSIRAKATTGELVQPGDAANNAIRVNVVAGAGSGGTAMVDDAAFTVGGTSITPAGGTYRSVRDAVDDGDGGAFAMNAKRGLYVTLETPASDSAMDEANDAVRVNIVAGAGSGGTAMTDDAAFTIGGTSFTPAGGTYNSIRDLVDDNDGGAFAMTQRRAQLVVLENSGGTEYTGSAPFPTKVTDGTLTATVRDTGTSDSLNVAIVDASGNQITSFGGGTQYTEDAASAADPVGNQLIARRRDTPAAETSADGDVIALNSTNKGELYVKHIDAIPVTDNAGSLTVDNTTLSVVGGGVEATALRVTLASDSTGLVSIDDNGGSLTVDGTVTANQGSAGTAWEVIGDIAHDAAGAAVNPLLVGAYASAAAPADVSADNDAVRLWALRNGSQVVNIAAGGTLTGTAGSPFGVKVSDGTNTAAVNAGGALATNIIHWGGVGLSVGATLADAVGNPVAPLIGAFTSVYNGSNWDRWRGNSTGGGFVQGPAAQDAAVAGNPLLAGGRASTAHPTAMSADGDAVDLWATRSGSPVVTMVPHIGLAGTGSPWTLTSKTAQYTTTQTSTVLQAGGASEKLVVTYIQIQAGGTTAGTVQVYFGTAAYSRGTSLAIFDGEFAPSSTLKPGFVANGPWISSTNGDDVLVTTSAAINPLTITIWYYILL